MRCPECDGVTKVVDSRKRPGFIYRRRRCECGVRFSTKETAFNVVLPPETEIARLEELNELIRSQIADVNSSLHGRMRTGGSGVSKRPSEYLDEPDRLGRNKHELLGGWLD